MEELIAYLDSIYPMTEALKNHLRNIIRHKVIKKGEHILMPPTISQNIHFINRGLFRAYYLSKKGKEVSAWFLAEGKMIVSIRSFYRGIPSVEYIQALEDSEVFYISRNELENIYKTFIEFNCIGRVLTLEYLQLWDQYLYGLRMLSAQERFEQLVQDDPSIPQRVPTKYIAAFLGISKYTLSRVKADAYKHLNPRAHRGLLEE